MQGGEVRGTPPDPAGGFSALHKKNMTLQTEKTWKQGHPVSYSGFDGAIIRHYAERMWEVRLESGDICVGESDLVDKREKFDPMEGYNIGVWEGRDEA
jgi:uncharacterized protein YdeI (BOF family)